jgi:hypothetical protein
MAYGIDPRPLYQLQKDLAELPEKLPDSARELERVLFSFLNAFDCLLALMNAVLGRCAERANDRRAYRRRFLPLFNQARERCFTLLNADIRAGLEANRFTFVTMTYALRDSFLADEMVILDESLTESEETANPEDHADAAETVTDSLKDFIKKFFGGKWIRKKRLDSALHTINEIISIVKKVV